MTVTETVPRDMGEWSTECGVFTSKGPGSESQLSYILLCDLEQIIQPRKSIFSSVNLDRYEDEIK